MAELSSSTETTDIFRGFNEEISAFVRRTENRRLLPGTGHYSTPFRGELFGLSDGAAVTRALQTRRVDALWLGSNPASRGRSRTSLATTPAKAIFQTSTDR